MPPARGAFLRAPRTPPAPDAAPVPSVGEPRPPDPFAAEDFDPPPLAPGADAVDQFLFEDKRGLCEQYASAMVVMLRELGIPSRLAAGFGVRCLAARLVDGRPAVRLAFRHPTPRLILSSLA